jgi:N6-adenosine-specific RNA methylase IME4
LTETLTTLPVQVVLARHAWGFFWTSGALLDKTRALMTAWRFEYSSIAFFWLKAKRSNLAPRLISTADIEAEFFFGLGLTTRQQVECVLLGRYGSPKRLAKNVRQIIVAPVREHSRKPDEFYQRVEQFCEGPRLDLFARETRRGWTPYGDEVAKFDAPLQLREAVRV